MQNDIKTLRIQNFKSIKDVTMTPRRVNLIIGMPNVGKSNILEAMSLLGSNAFEKTNKLLGSFIRYNEPRQLFYDNITSNYIKIETDKDVAMIKANQEEKNFNYLIISKKSFYDSTAEFALKANDSLRMHVILKDLDINKYGDYPDYLYTKFDNDAQYNIDVRMSDKPSYLLNIALRNYSFNKKSGIDEEYMNSFLQPPFGDNLIDIIKKLPYFRREVASLFEPYGLKLLLRMDERRLEVVKDLDGIIYSYPYSSIADTLQRIIFYLAAIESNDDAVILLEEPEAHSYPMYVSMLGKRMVESRNNQFFVATHSPYLITEVLEQMLPDEVQAQELAIFVAYYEDYQTKVKQLSDEEVQAIRGDSVDVFYNMARYIPRPADG